MKRGLLFILILTISIASAQPILTIQNQNPQLGETILGEITTTGGFAKQLSLSDIQFFQGRRQIYFEYGLVYYNRTYFFYTIPTTQNFTIKINNILYKSPELNSETIERQILLNTSNSEVLSIKPGFVFASRQPELTLKNKGTSQLNITYDEQEISLAPDSFQKILFTPAETFSYLAINSYETFNIPVIYIPLTSDETEKLEIKIKSNPSIIYEVLFTNQQKNTSIELINFGENITDISVSTDIDLLEIQEINSIESKSVKNLTLTFNPQNQEIAEGKINITFLQDNLTQEMIIPASIYVLSAGSSEEDFKIQEQTCGQLGGVQCSSEQTCTGEVKFTYLSEICCLDTCELTNQPEPKSYKWVWGIIIFVVLGIAGFFIYKKIKKTKPRKPEQKLNKTSKLYEKKVRGSLSRN